MKTIRLFIAVLIITLVGPTAANENEKTPRALNPVIWADVPDIAIIRVGNIYYMSSTTMHMSPGLPIMRSNDLVNWEVVSYAHGILGENEYLRLENGKNAYGRGTWASSLRYHEGVFYASTFSFTTGNTYVFTTRDIENGTWDRISFQPVLFDHTLFFDHDGKVYMLHGGGDIRITELKSDLTGVKPGGVNKVLIPDAGRLAAADLMLPAEGSQMIYHDGKYYLFNITWPRDGMRTVIVHRANNILGPYEGRVALQDRGIAQGSIIQTPGGEWYAYMFRDFGAVGRIPYMIPMTWKDGWPVLGINGKVPDTLDIPVENIGVKGIVATDEFNRRGGDNTLPLVWQWNHNPDNRFWSLTQRRGHLRLTTGRVDSDVLQARNTLTQRTFGPLSSATVSMDVRGMKDGDRAGLIALQRRYGSVGVKMENGARYIFMVSAQDDTPVELAKIPLDQNKVYLRIECDFRDRADIAYFYYSLNGRKWERIGAPLQMTYTLPQHFMGYRFGLFNYATNAPGGFVDFNFFRLSDRIGQQQNATFRMF
ncbi:MAG TPA: glycoside hydrolase 43 family protein [Bacteroidales bacterium]|nr:glycoside hydrolase 43 family protein [Bacteroidales bacterium]